MGNFQGGDRRGGGGFRGGNSRGGRPNFQKKSFGGGGFRDREVVMHKAVCSECGKNCEVPFRPTGDKPVYCSDCFSSKREDGGERAPRRDFESREPRREYSSDRPSSTSSFSKPTSAPAFAQDDTKKQLREIGMKLDRLITVMERLSQAKESAPVAKAIPAVIMAPKMTAPKIEVKKILAVKTVAKKVVVAKTPAKKVVVKKTVVTKKNK